MPLLLRTGGAGLPQLELSPHSFQSPLPDADQAPRRTLRDQPIHAFLRFECEVVPLFLPAASTGSAISGQLVSLEPVEPFVSSLTVLRVRRVSPMLAACDSTKKLCA